MSGIFASRNLMRKLMAMNIMQVGVIFFFISLAKKLGGMAPIFWKGRENVVYDNPLPHALMLTAIVVGVATTGVALALLIRIRRNFKTLDEGEILEKLKP
jgi:multicomponent Na+:H+ antiporter subunit C